MAVSTTFDNNLAILLLGTSMTGGLAYGGYRVFKNNPRPVTELMKSRGRIALDKESEKSEWNKNWLKYIAENTTTRTVTSAEPNGKSKNTTETKINDDDLWSLEDWKSQKDKKEAPESFKNKCEELKDKKMLGTWSAEYTNYEKYCTKLDNSEE